MNSTNTVQTTTSEPAPLARLAAVGGPGSRIVCTPATALCVGDALLLPHFNQIHTLTSSEDKVKATGVGGFVHTFETEEWMWILRPAWPAMPCPGCERTWLNGCNESCDARLIHPHDLAEAFAAAGLLAPGVTVPDH